MRPCVLCGRTDAPADDEHVIPKWARNAFALDGVTVHASDGPGSGREQIARMQHMNIVLRGSVCRPCNNGWLAAVIRRVAPLLKPMAAEAKPTVLDAAAQALVALWAVKTVLLLELAARQRYRGSRSVEGYTATTQELAWLREQDEPPPRSMVWLTCWDCQRSTPVNYEPSAADLPAADGSQVAGHLTTFTLGFAAFQVFTVDFIEAERRGAPVWNTRPPAQLTEALKRIWPPQLTVPDLSWPPAAFGKDDWQRLVTWDGVLRPGEHLDRPGTSDGPVP
jgi:hypothetical protein